MKGACQQDEEVWAQLPDDESPPGALAGAWEGATMLMLIATLPRHHEDESMAPVRFRTLIGRRNPGARLC